VTDLPVRALPVPVSDSRAPPRVATKVPPLTTRQLEVMRLLSEGCPVKEIAYRLNLGIGTVKVHLSLAYSALGAHNRIEAIQRAGLLTLQGQIQPAA
jgi:DNA-binding NarL/FixJ family response regulator